MQERNKEVVKMKDKKENKLIEDPPAGENIENENKILSAENKELPPIPDSIEKKAVEEEKEEKKSIVFMPEYTEELNTFGRPRKFKDSQELETAIKDYFDVYCGNIVLKDGKGNILKDKFGNPISHIKPPTVAGLCLKLGFLDRQSIYDYVNRNDTFSCIIKSALLTIEQFAESMLYTGKPVGAIFWLKNHKWTDQQQIDVKNSTFESFLKSYYDKDKPNEIEEGNQVN